MIRFSVNILSIFFFSQTLHAQGNDSYSLMKNTFTVPKNITTSCYWYWVSGNISKQGVTNDLKAMKKAGINRAFIGNQGLSPEDDPRGPIKIQSQEWYEIIHTAMKTASQEGIEIGMFNGPGWSHAGGPWNKPGQSMRFLASQHAIVKGGGKQTITFSHPDNWLENVKVLAFRRKHSTTRIQSGIDHLSADGVNDVAALFDGSQTTVSGFSTDIPTFYIKASKDKFQLRSVRIEIASPIKGDITISVKRNGKYVNVTNRPLDRTNMMIEIGYYIQAPIAISIPETEGNEFRLDFHINKDCKLREITLSEDPIVDNFPDKILGKMVQVPLPTWNDYKWKSNTDYEGNNVVAEKDIIDITSSLSADVLTYTFPEGDWEIVRTYMAPTMITNGPTIAGDGKGLEVDRWNHDALKHHYDSFIGDLMKRIPASDRTTWKMLVCDSYEKATQNYSDDFMEYFKAHFGYDPTPYLLTYDGIVVGSTEKSERFLWDLRRMIADRLAYDHIGGLRDLGHQDGLKLWLECYGHWGFPGEFLQYGGQSDEVAGEFWSEGSLGDIENRAASSAAHIYGKGKVSAESFTCGPPEFSRSPRYMKQRGDKFFTEGVNNTLLHLIVSQPNENSFPGFNCPFGQEFNRKNTWYSHLNLFTDYLKRCNYMLQQGQYVADVAYFIGEDAPVMTGITEPKLPQGYQYDFINAEVIKDKLTVGEDHLLKLPYGNQYKLLVLPPLKTMRLDMLRRLKTLIQNGAVVLGPKPLRSPSLKDWGAGDAEIKIIADELWGHGDPFCEMRRIGKGILFTGYEINDVFRIINNHPDASFIGTKNIKYAHTSNGNIDIYFITNQTDKPTEFIAQLRVTGKQPELWTPTDGAIRQLPSFSQEGKSTSIPMRLSGNESAFIVLAKPAKVVPTSLDINKNYPRESIIKTINSPWNVSLKSMVYNGKRIILKQLIDLSTSDDEYVKYFSGTSTYKTLFTVSGLKQGLLYKLDLGKVYEMAKVKLNGQYVGGVWTSPYTIDISKYLKNGKNEIEIEVVNNWMNRLIGDRQKQGKDRKTFCSHATYDGNTPLQSSGLIGPVRILEANLN
ncbi:hypothetical protein HMPREF1199_01183 [Hoylesella oralis CC98A]|nr:hypothetical protein HMPREF1199_01183 [Hoylesella oralis CC98A]